MLQLSKKGNSLKSKPILFLRFDLTDDQKMVVNLLAAKRNDVNRLINAFLENQDLTLAGYGGSTLLHVAAG